MGVGVTPLLRRKAKIGSSDDRKAPVQAKVGFSGTQIHSIPQRKTRRREPAAIKRQMTREPLFVCQVCGHRGADVRPLFEPARMGTGG
jgi:hypothetical protein